MGARVDALVIPPVFAPFVHVEPWQQRAAAVRTDAQEPLAVFQLVAHDEHFVRRLHRRTRVVHAVVQQRLAHQRAPTGREPRLHHERRVLKRRARRLAKADALIVEPSLAIEPRPDRGDRADDARLLDGIEKPAVGEIGEVAYAVVMILVVLEKVAFHEVAVMSLRHAEQAFEHVALREVVGLNDADVRAACGLDAAVHRSAVPRIRLVDDDDALVLPRPFLQNRQ